MIELEEGKKLVYRYGIHAKDVTQFFLMVDANVNIDEKAGKTGLAALVLLDGVAFEEPESINSMCYKRISLNDFKDRNGNNAIKAGMHTIDLLVFTKDNLYEAHARFLVK